MAEPEDLTHALAQTRRPRPSRRIDVLVIDDSELMRASVVRALMRAGFSVAELASPIGATGAILRSGARAVLIDLDMPAMRGDLLITSLRRMERMNDVKLVLMSAHDGEALRAKALSAGADAIVAKADGHEGIVRTLTKALASE